MPVVSVLPSTTSHSLPTAALQPGEEEVELLLPEVSPIAKNRVKRVSAIKENCKMIKPNQYQHHYTHLNGLKYHYVASKPTTNTNIKQNLVIFIHGFPEVWYTWKDQMNLFKDTKKYRVVALDMVGYGQTEIPDDLNKYTYQSVSLDVISLIKNELRYNKAILIGHNWGSYIAFHMARIQPDIVQAIVSLSSGYYPIPLRPKSLIKSVPQLGYQLNFAKPNNCYHFNDNLDEFLASFWTYKYESILQSCLAAPPDSDFIEFVHNLKKQKEYFPEPDVKKFITDQFKLTGTCGATNWYKTSELNYDFATKNLNTSNTQLNQPVMLMVGEEDFAKSSITVGTDFLHNHTVEIIDHAGHFLHLSHSLIVFSTISKWLSTLML